jgi:hypothetical protein
VRDEDVDLPKPSTDAATQTVAHVDLTICRLLLAKFGTANESFRQLRDRLRVSTLSLRPDIAVFMGGAYYTTRRCPKAGHSWGNRCCTAYEGERRLVIFELGYVREGFAQAKQLQKRSQHALLECLLVDRGWRVEYHTVTLGVAGTIYNDALATLRSLGLSALVVTQVVCAWIRMTLNHTHGLVTHRRHLDSPHINKAFQKPP